MLARGRDGKVLTSLETGMNATTVKDKPMAKKKTTVKAEPKRYGSLIRVSDAFADAINTASSFEKMSVSEFADLYLVPVVQKRYKDAVTKEAKRLEGNG
jgi:hypothetical protein